MGHAALGRPPPGPPGEMGRRPRRGFRFRRAGQGQHLPRPPGAGCGRPLPRARRQHRRRAGRLHVGGGPGSSTNAPAAAMGGGYVIPAIFMDVRGAFTNTAPLDAYRGAGKPEANYLIERLIDKAAGQCGFDPIELRRRNLIASFPYQKALGTTVDCGRFAANIDDVLPLSDHAGFAQRRAGSRAKRAAARHRRRVLSGNRPRRPQRRRGNPFRRRRHRHHAGRHPKQRPGPRNRLPPDRRRSARASPRAISLPAGRHCGNP